MTIMYLFDTDTLSNLLMSKPSFSLLARLKEVRRRDQYTTAIALEELVYKAYKGPDSSHLITQLTQLLLPNLHVLPFDYEAALKCGQLRAALCSERNSLLDRDLKTASICLLRDLLLVTSRKESFRPIQGLRIEKWAD